MKQHRFARCAQCSISITSLLGSAVLLASCSSPEIATDESVIPKIGARVGVKPDWSLPFDAHSTAWDGVSNLTASAAVSCALANNRPLRSALESVHAAQSELVQSSLPPNPMLELGTGIPFGVAAAPILAMVSQNLAFLASRDHSMSAATARLRQALLDTGATAVNVAAEARSLHALVVAAQEELRLAMADQHVAGQQLDVASASVNAGETACTELEEFRMEVADTDARRAEAALSLDTARLQLLAVIGRSDAAMDWIAVGDSVLPTADLLIADSLVARVTEWRLDVQAAQQAALGARAELEVAANSRISQFNIAGGYERDMEGDRAISLGLTAELPIFDDGSARISAARARYEAARIEADRVLQQAVLEARVAQATLVAKLELLRAQGDVALAAAESAAKTALRASQAGDAPHSRYLKLEHAANHQRLLAAAARRDVGLAQIELARVIGSIEGTNQ